ncbi:uncharacterized protein LOC142983747 isoform X3 [Anticarsia gemmatalis]|uniref:uncharacterized protein LOC142983747 isoform X3 n=1 Tax=Anticarsia gemmatalis TaxID=129554 RepID=UPI003F7614F2
MDLFYILVLIPLSVNAGYDGPSYRSSVMDGDKPILRGGGPEPEEADISGRALTAEDSSDMKVIPLKINNIEAGDEDEDSEERDQKTARDLSVLVGWLIENYGYAIVKPSRRQQDPSSKPTEAAPFMKARENSKHKQKNKGSKKKGKSSKHKGVKSEPKQKKRSLRMQRLVYPERRDNKNQDNKNEENKNQEIKNQDNKSDPIDDSKITGTRNTTLVRASDRGPTWRAELKGFMRDLIRHVSMASLDRYTRPVVNDVEKKNNVLITDIDMDTAGHILIDYVDLSVPTRSRRIIRDKGKQYRASLNNGFSDQILVDLTRHAL